MMVVAVADTAASLLQLWANWDQTRIIRCPLPLPLAPQVGRPLRWPRLTLPLGPRIMIIGLILHHEEVLLSHCEVKKEEAGRTEMAADAFKSFK